MTFFYSLLASVTNALFNSFRLVSSLRCLVVSVMGSLSSVLWMSWVWISAMPKELSSLWSPFLSVALMNLPCVWVVHILLDCNQSLLTILHPSTRAHGERGHTWQQTWPSPTGAGPTHTLPVEAAVDPLLLQSSAALVEQLTIVEAVAEVGCRR